MFTPELKAKCDAEVQFILSEMERHHRLVLSEASFAERFGAGHAALGEFTATVTYKPTGREFVVGREALRRFRIIALSVLEPRTDYADWNIGELADQLRATFLDYVFTEGLEDAATIVEPWIEAAVRFVRSRHRRHVHYIPCVALEIGGQETYSFGPITFSRKSAFFEKFLDSMMRYDRARERLSVRAQRNAAPAMQWCWKDQPESTARVPEERFKEFTKETDWVAQVPVCRCAHSVSENRAEAVLRLAMASITLLLDGTEGAGLRLVDDPFVPRHTNKLSSPGKGFVRPSSSWTFGGPKAENGWQGYLESVAQPILATVYRIFDKILAGDVLSHGEQIAIRAITWYADAVRDTNPETRLIKCATAVECIVLPDRFDTTATFVIRGSLLAQQPGTTMMECAVIAKRLYERRSDVAHGNLDSLLAARNESTREALEFARNAILQFLALCAWPQMQSPTRSGTRQDFLDLYRFLEGGRHAEIQQIKSTFNFKGWKVVPAPDPQARGFVSTPSAES